MKIHCDLTKVVERVNPREENWIMVPRIQQTPRNQDPLFEKLTYIFRRKNSDCKYKSRVSGRDRRVQDFWTRTRFIEYFRTRDLDPDPRLLYMFNFREIFF
jgi:hypothetical protein